MYFSKMCYAWCVLPAPEDRDGDGGGEHPKSADLGVELGVVGEERHGGREP